MAKRRTIIDKQIEQVDYDISVLQQLRVRLVAQRDEQESKRAAKAQPPAATE
jgi:hypothetical protein